MNIKQQRKITIYKHCNRIIKVDIPADNQKHDFYSDLFDAVADLPPEKVRIEEASKIEDIFIDNDLSSDTKIEDGNKQNIDDLLRQVNHGGMSIAQPIVQAKTELRKTTTNI